MRVIISTPEQMESLGQTLAQACTAGTQIHLSGGLGAGKTTLVRGFVHGLGHHGSVKSPTYTLVEPYSFVDLSVFHFDFYRVNHPYEIESIGFREYPGKETICLIEWPEKGGDLLGQPDLLISIEIRADSRDVKFEAYTEKGNSLILKISNESGEN